MLIGILSLISYPTYNEHVIRVRRACVAAALVDLAGRMETYYLANNTYSDATLEKLSVNSSHYEKYYRLDVEAKDDLYTLKAIPVGKQTKDVACGSLILDQTGNKKVSGSEEASKCWI